MADGIQNTYIGAADYVVFGLMLAISASIGFFYAYKDRKRNDMENFHHGNKKANPVAVSLSLSVTVITALTMIGTPAEVYTFGTMISWQAVAILFATAFAAHFFLPIFYRMDKISLFQYFQKRFGTIPRILSSVLFLIFSFIFISFVLYSPCLAFEAMTGISLWVVMAVTSFVCMTYTLLGGMKAVIWADTVQYIIMLVGIICMIVEGSKAVGGFSNAWDIANRHNRIQFTDFSFDPRTRHSVWNICIGFFLSWSVVLGTNQATIQRACSLPTLKVAQLAIWASYPGLLLLVVMSVMNGVIMFAYYHTCDPVAMKRVLKRDQLFPLFIVDIVGNIPGLPGLLLASLFSGALSTISSGLSAISAVFVEDFVVPYTRKPLSDKTQLVISRIVVVAIAVIQYFIAGGIAQLGGLIVQLITQVTSLIAGPLLGFFLAGMLFPWTNTRGLCVGLVVSLCFSGWLIIGTFVHMSGPTPLPVSTEGCQSNVNVTSPLTTAQTEQSTTNMTVLVADETSAIDEFYRMSYQWYTAFGMSIFVIVALTVSFLTNPTNPKDVDSSLMVPLFYRLCPFLPERFRKKLLFGVDYDKKSDSDLKPNKLVTFFLETNACTEINKSMPNPINLSHSTHL